MYRIVFISKCLQTQRLIIEKGPIHPRKETAEKWLNYFSGRGHPAHMRIERLRPTN